MKKIFLTATIIITSYCSHAQSFFTPSSYANAPQGVGANSIFGWGENFDRTIDIRPNPHPTYGTMMINYHTGLTFSAHSVYGGIRFYNQGYPNPYDPATGSIMVMSIVNGNVGIGTTSPGTKLELKYGVQNALTLPLAINPGFYQSGSASGIGFLTDGNTTYTKGALAYTSNGTGWNVGDFQFLLRNDNNTNIVTLADAKMTIKASGNVGIGTTTPDEKLSVLGKIHAKEVKVDLSVPGPDYVFEPAYKLPQLNELKNYLDKNHHLPEIPSAKQMAKEGINLGDMNIKLLKKVEELTLYLIEKDKQATDQQKQLDELKQELANLKKAASQKN
jgi:hypothetical protein